MEPVSPPPKILQKKCRKRRFFKMWRSVGRLARFYNLFVNCWTKIGQANTGFKDCAWWLLGFDWNWQLIVVLNIKLSRGEICVANFMNPRMLLVRVVIFVLIIWLYRSVKIILVSFLSIQIIGKSLWLDEWSNNL